MWSDRVSNPGPPTYESGALPAALRGLAPEVNNHRLCILKFTSKGEWVLFKGNQHCLSPLLPFSMARKERSRGK